ncbi:nucleoside hydrolase [Segetibacter koreensis]|uniref:nucleoside hydrolase n=1 Tax=Segetibacter koreensis TaxID=398037 RepID=UPI00037780EF|nr:nucleoside hydrolase [Segetibacter koreensis]
MIKYLFLSFFLVYSIGMKAQTNKALPVIFDTDMGPDYDDVGAITLLHAFADSGKAKILATIASTKYEGVAAVLNVFNTYFKKAEIPIGVPKGNALTLKDFQHWTDTLIAKYPHTIKSNDEVPDAVELYRKILAKQPDNSVTIITVGFLTNISNLLQSKPDKYSSLNGKELVNKKVKNMVTMGGKFPAGKEFNIEKDAVASKYAYEHFEKPVLFSGFEIGEKIKTGLPLVNNDAIQNSPVKDVFSLCLPMAKEDKEGRMSWDETAVFVAVAGYKPFYTLKKGTIQIADDGSNTWNGNGTKHHHLVKERPPSEVEKVINDLMIHQP